MLHTKGGRTAVSSATLVSSKRSASTAEMDANIEISSGSKRQRIRRPPTKAANEALADQNGIYAAEKFSDSLSISHVVNLLVQSENQSTHA